jgi:hypothetical protein
MRTGVRAVLKCALKDRSMMRGEILEDRERQRR